MDFYGDKLLDGQLGGPRPRRTGDADWRMRAGDEDVSLRMRDVDADTRMRAQEGSGLQKVRDFARRAWRAVQSEAGYVRLGRASDVDAVDVDPARRVGDEARVSPEGAVAPYDRLFAAEQLGGVELRHQVQLAEAARAHLVDVPYKGPTIAASPEGAVVHSGWSWGADQGYVQGTEQAMRLASEIGYEFKRAGAADQGVPGQYNASHADAQMLALTGGGPMAISKKMCPSCTGLFQRYTSATGATVVVADVTMLGGQPVERLRVFFPDGSIVDL